MSPTLRRLLRFRHGVSAWSGDVNGEPVSMFTSGRVIEPPIEAAAEGFDWPTIALVLFTVGVVIGWFT